MNCRTLMERALVVLDSVALSDRQHVVIGTLALLSIECAKRSPHEMADMAEAVIELMREG